MGEHKHEGTIITLVVLCMLMVTVIGLELWLDDRLDNIEQNAQRKVCHTEEYTKKIELSLGNLDYNYSYEFNENDEINCEEGVVIYHNLRVVDTYTEDVKVCLITTQKEVCEIK